MEDPRPAMQNALKDAMKNKETLRRDVIRMAQSAIKQVEIDDQKELSPEEVVTIIQREIKKRRESIEELANAGREEQADNERSEVTILESFLPQQLSEDEVRAIVQEVIQKTGASSPKEMGKVMGPVMQQVKGLADGTLVNRIVREELSS